MRKTEKMCIRDRPKADQALLADSIGTVAGAIFGTSTVTTYVESASGVADGGRTGLTAVTVAALFLLSLFFAPLVSLIPAAATAPALVIVGIDVYKRQVYNKIASICGRNTSIRSTKAGSSRFCRKR